jgi:hypothetical protein
MTDFRKSQDLDAKLGVFGSVLTNLTWGWRLGGLEAAYSKDLTI